MNRRRRTQTERTGATRAALIRAARDLFALRGYEHTSLIAVSESAGVSKGAVYHQFGSKKDLFRAVFETVEAEVTEQVAEAIRDQPARRMISCGVDAFLAAVSQPTIHQISLIDAPLVLGWREWRETSSRYGLGLLAEAISRAMQRREVARQPIPPLVDAILGAARECAIYMVQADDQARACRDAKKVMAVLLKGMLDPR